MIASPRTCLMAGKGIHRRRTPERHRRRRRRRCRHHPTDSAPKPDGCESERGTWRKNQPGRNARDKQQIPKGFRKRRPAGIVFAAHPSTLKPFSILKSTPRAPANGTQQSNTGSTFVTRVVLHVLGRILEKTSVCSLRGSHPSIAHQPQQANQEKRS